MKCIKTAAKHAVPVIKERMVIIDAAEEKGDDKPPNLPVSIKQMSSDKNHKLTK